MTRNWLWVLFVFFTFPAAAQTAYPACATVEDACQNNPISPPSLEPPLASSREHSPDTSALAPMLSPGNSSLIKTGLENPHTLHNSHDNELLAVPDKKRVLKDPFGQAMMQPLHVTPQNP